MITKTKRKYTPRKRAKPKKPEVVFYGTPYEKQVLEVCHESRFPFDFRRAKIGGYVVDFINRGKRLILEVYNPEREWAEVMDRMKAFAVQLFTVKYISKDTLSQRNRKKLIATSIKRFLE